MLCFTIICDSSTANSSIFIIVKILKIDVSTFKKKKIIEWLMTSVPCTTMWIRLYATQTKYDYLTFIGKKVGKLSRLKIIK